LTIQQIDGIRCTGTSPGGSDAGASSPNEPILHALSTISVVAENAASADERRGLGERTQGCPHSAGLPSNEPSGKLYRICGPDGSSPPRAGRASEPKKRTQGRSGERMTKLPNVLTRGILPIVPRVIPRPGPARHSCESTKRTQWQTGENILINPDSWVRPVILNVPATTPRHDVAPASREITKRTQAGSRQAGDCADRGQSVES
jgi:hypothetical protein